MGVGVVGVTSTAVRRYVRPSWVVGGSYDLMKFTEAFIEYSAG